MLYIHGGGPFGNSSRYRADYLMDEDIIFITLHYRLGALGKPGGVQSLPFNLTFIFQFSLN
jgi:hypothetical protein